MIKKIKTSIKQYFEQQNEILNLNKELDWANVYHDSIRGKVYLEKLSLNIGRWAGNYSFFYVLNRILSEFKPESILEMGLGESTKFIMAYLDNDLKSTKHLVIEQDENWMELFKKSVSVSENTKIKIHPIHQIMVKGFSTSSYNNLTVNISGKFDLYVIDGPFGSKNYSRYDIINLANKFESNDEFIILFDDYNRLGEQETVRDLLQILTNKEIKIFKKTYIGIKTVLVIATEKYRYASSL